MPLTIIGPESQPFPLTVYPAVVEVKQDWDDPWLFEPRLELVACTLAVGSAGRDTLTVKRRYGQTKQPWEADLTVGRLADDLLNIMQFWCQPVVHKLSTGQKCPFWVVNNWLCWWFWP